MSIQAGNQAPKTRDGGEETHFLGVPCRWEGGECRRAPILEFIYSCVHNLISSFIRNLSLLLLPPDYHPRQQAKGLLYLELKLPCCFY